MVRVLAHALQAPTTTLRHAAAAGRGLSDTDEPDLWRHDRTSACCTGSVGQPTTAAWRAGLRPQRASRSTHPSSTPQWWKGVADRWRAWTTWPMWLLDAAASKGAGHVATLLARLQVTVTGRRGLGHRRQRDGGAATQALKAATR